MTPEEVSEALFECERAIQDYTDRVTSRLRDSSSRGRASTTTLEKKLETLMNTVKDTHTSANSSHERRLKLVLRMNSLMDSPHFGFTEAGVQVEPERKSVGIQTDAKESGGEPGV